MKKPLVILLAGLWFGALAACNEATVDAQPVGEPARLDAQTHALYCDECPAPEGQTVHRPRKPVADGATGELMCMPCETIGYCGDGACGLGETCGSCSVDCQPCPPPTPYCGDGACNGCETSASCLSDCGSPYEYVVGRIALYCGKVNDHRAPGENWTWDADCTSGCNVGGLAYCQKFWPASTRIRQVPVSSKPANVWANAGCGPVADDWDGNEEFECVAD